MSNLEDNNIYTLLDVHQDVLWRWPERYGGSYWGVPSWIKDKLVGNAKPFPWPFKGNRSFWPCDYFTEEILKGFGRFYENYSGAADDFAAFWSIVAKR